MLLPGADWPWLYELARDELGYSCECTGFHLFTGRSCQLADQLVHRLRLSPGEHIQFFPSYHVSSSHDRSVCLEPGLYDVTFRGSSIELADATTLGRVYFFSLCMHICRLGGHFLLPPSRECSEEVEAI